VTLDRLDTSQIDPAVLSRGWGRGQPLRCNPVDQRPLPHREHHDPGTRPAEVYRTMW